MSRLVSAQDKPWAKPADGSTKKVELSAEAFAKLSKFAAKRGLMTLTPGEALLEMMKTFRVEENS